jgi:beta-carotene hydroxylase
MVTALPTLDELGRELLHISRKRLIISLMTPFVVGAAAYLFAAGGLWAFAIASVAMLTFITYGSISHDLVHKSLGLPSRVNDLLLTSIELLMLRSGRAYRLAHLNHHARFPDSSDDPEGQAAHGTVW